MYVRKGTTSMRMPNPSDLPLLGVSLSGPPPIGVLDVLLPKGVTVLYGKNGVGKTKVLDVIRRALNGRSVNENSWVHLRFQQHDLERPGGEVADVQIILALWNALASRATERNSFDDKFLVEDPEPTSVRALVEVLLRELWETDMDSPTGISNLINEVAGQGYFSLVPIGREGQRLWRVMVAARPSDDTPTFNWVIECERQLDQEKTRLLTLVDQGELAAEDALSEIRSALDLALFQSKERRTLPMTPFTESLQEFKYEQRAPWAPLPLISVGILELPVGFSLSLSDDHARNLAESTFRLVRTSKPIVDLVTEDEVIPTNAAAQIVSQLGAQATKKLQQIFGDDGPLSAMPFSALGHYTPCSLGGLGFLGSVVDTHQRPRFRPKQMGDHSSLYHRCRHDS